jgi:ABC-type multidrug transport system ATPase subunit
VLILDEPTGAIDPVAAHELLGLIIDIVEEEGLACMISSHRLEEIEALHSHVLLLDRGRIRYDGDLDELRDMVDRQQLEIEFRTDEGARQARKLIENAGLGESMAVEGGLPPPPCPRTSPPETSSPRSSRWSAMSSISARWKGPSATSWPTCTVRPGPHERRDQARDH